MTPGMFWSLTPRELIGMIDGNQMREKAKDRRAAWIVMNIANTSGRLKDPLILSDLFREE